MKISELLEFPFRARRIDFKFAKVLVDGGKGESHFPRISMTAHSVLLSTKSDLTIPCLRTHLVYCRSYRMGCVRDRMARDQDRVRDRSLRDFLAVFR